jgi:hypothetical protein
MKPTDKSFLCYQPDGNIMGLKHGKIIYKKEIGLAKRWKESRPKEKYAIRKKLFS